jgi:hypothetical protein
VCILFKCICVAVILAPKVASVYINPVHDPLFVFTSSPLQEVKKHRSDLADGWARTLRALLNLARRKHVVTHVSYALEDIPPSYRKCLVFINIMSRHIYDANIVTVTA